MSMTSASTMYMTPIRLWSVDVIHSLHRYGHHPFRQTQMTMAAMIRMTTTEVISGIGWLNGIASQVSLPNIACVSQWRLRRDVHRRRRCSWRNRQWSAVGHDGVEQSGRHAPVGQRL